MTIPGATYRLQFTPEFGFGHARAILPYLHELGVSDIYASPIFHARSGSNHGYDVVDANRLNPELGTVEEFETLVGGARRLQLGWIQDIVPNHMAYDSQNRMLMDVLENGTASAYADFFDIDWNHPYDSMKGKILAPFLGRFYGECLEDGEITLHYDEGGLSVRYFAMTLPVNIEAYGELLTDDLSALRRRLGARHLDYVKLLGVLYAIKNLAPTEQSVERTDQIEFVKRILWELYSTNEEIKRYVDANLAKYNGRKGEPETFDRLDRLLSHQWYRLSFWKVAAEELNYRRFFNINELISLRLEEEKVYRHTHG
ncbi:MAG TPA: alpha-amylase family glycosyl hydrolase, partial [Candidatus Binatus sp.]|nr:alpha-amylase family glycosyl hydrolase [Candidatus Binatus sp.]